MTDLTNDVQYFEPKMKKITRKRLDKELEDTFKKMI